MGAAGRDFHDFLTFLRERPELVVRAFTAAQIPFIAHRSFPRALAGPGYDADIPILPEEELSELIRREGIDLVFLAYSDLSHQEVMHKQSLVMAAGAAFVMLGPRQTQLVASRPVIAVTAVRTGAGKSPVSQQIARHLSESGRRVGVLRHPMPYGDLERQAVQRFARHADLDRFECTIEEREEYEPYLDMGLPVFAGVDYRRILELAEAEAEVIVWDGGNNDYAFVRPTLSIVLADALRPGHELDYYPGEANLRAADVVIINKVGAASADALARVRRNVAALAPGAPVIEGDLAVRTDRPEAMAGRRVLVVEDGPTLTHGGMATGAGWVAARSGGAEAIVDPRPFAVGSIAETLRENSHIGPVLPAMGYSEAQRQELAQTIRASGAEVVVDASPASLQRVVRLDLPIVRVRYHFVQRSGPPLLGIVDASLRTSAAARTRQR